MSDPSSGIARAGVLLLTLGSLAGLGLGGIALTGGEPSGPGNATTSPIEADTVTLVETTAVTPRTDGVAETGGSADEAEQPPRAGEHPDPARPDRAKATFAGGCFWCMEPPYDRLEGVHSTISGYTGGRIEDPTYRQVASGQTRHREVVQVTYDPSTVSYTKLLQVFWHNIDPTDDGGQFCDRGFQYTTAIFAHNEEQERLARKSKRRLKEWESLPGPVVTTVAEAEEFYAAEEYHQNFYRTHSAHYERYREGCRRDDRLRQIWGEAAPH